VLFVVPAIDGTAIFAYGIFIHKYGIGNKCISVNCNLDIFVSGIFGLKGLGTVIFGIKHQFKPV